ncbi:MAG: sorbosone dehydrogenase [Xanthobacteraceae bacterium]|nr:sorbosone dehydrogenase [Xanthobacteraceae bacterium]
MSLTISVRRRLLAGTVSALLLAGLPALAQQPPADPPAASPAPTMPAPAAPAPAATPAPAPAAAPAIPPGSPLFGRPNSESAAKLAPVAPPPIPTAAEKLPLDKLKVPAGFKVEVYASGIANARSLREGDKGTVFVGARLVDKVSAIVNKDGKRTVKVIASGLHRPNGLAFKDGTLYIAELSKISKIEKIEDNLDNPPKPTMIYDDLPKDEAHGWKFIAIGPDNMLYIPVGQPCNNCLPPDTHAQIRRIGLDGKGMEVVARGVRNTVGFDWHPTSKEMYFTDNGRDWMSEDVPEDELNRITKVGQHFGAPFCYQGNVLDAELGWGKSCSDYEKPVSLMGPHSAALGMRFNTSTKFPAKFKNTIFVARHGSWNRSKKVGGDVVAVQLDAKGNVKSVEPFMTGFLGADNNYVARPVDVLFMKDGSMLVSDDFNGAVYRVSYGK